MDVVAVVGRATWACRSLSSSARSFTIGYDLSAEKVASYRRHRPDRRNLERERRSAAQLTVTTDPKGAGGSRRHHRCGADAHRRGPPASDFAPLVGSSAAVGKHMKRGAVVVYESTVYPGATEEVCVPVLEKNSEMKWLKDFNVGYSPSASTPATRSTRSRESPRSFPDTPATLEKVAGIYGAVVKAGVYRASSIKVAEAAKVIETHSAT
jgi:UDP-N-acetyl-D-galactosamine dehydrogenase